jgi:cysteine desulfurase/selenocysteine lyase
MITQELEDNQKEIIAYLNEELNKIEGLKIYGQGANKIPLFSFAVAGCNHGDIATLLDKLGIAVRSGLMCCEPLISGFGHTGLVRASFAPYNTLEEAQTLVQGLHRVVRMLR